MQYDFIPSLHGLSAHQKVQYWSNTIKFGCDRKPGKSQNKHRKLYSSSPVFQTDRCSFFWKKLVTKIFFFFKFLDNCVKYFTPCVMKPQNLSCGVTWDRMSLGFYVLLVLSSSINQPLSFLCRTQPLLAPNALSPAFVGFFFSYF